MPKIYILKLNQEKYYIGISTNITKRLSQHQLGVDSAKWVKRWQYKSILDIIDQKVLFHEDILTKEFMYKYGIMNVRGGSYSNCNLTVLQLLTLQTEFYTAENKCFTCGGHFSRHHKCRNPSLAVQCYYCRGFGHLLFGCPQLL